MKKKNTKSCFTWLKNVFVSHPINKASLCLTLSMVSLVSVGFSSWMLVGGAVETGPIDVTVGEIVGHDYLGSAYYLRNSEKYFQYTIHDDNLSFRDSYVSLDVVLNYPLVNECFTDDINVDIGLRYSYRSILNYSLFDNPSVCSPVKQIAFSYGNNDLVCFNGGDYKTSNSSNSGITEESIIYSTILFSPTDNSLSSFFSYYGDLYGKISLKAKIYFDVVDSSAFAKIVKNIDLQFITTLRGIDK